MAITEQQRLRLLEGFRDALDDDQLATLSEVVHIVSPDLVSQDDFNGGLLVMRADLEGAVATMRADLDTGLADLRTEMATGLADLRTDMATGAADLRTEMAQHLKVTVAAQLTMTLLLLGFMIRLA